MQEQDLWISAVKKVFITHSQFKSDLGARLNPKSGEDLPGLEKLCIWAFFKMCYCWPCPCANSLTGPHRQLGGRDERDHWAGLRVQVLPVQHLRLAYYSTVHFMLHSLIFQADNIWTLFNPQSYPTCSFNCAESYTYKVESAVLNNHPSANNSKDLWVPTKLLPVHFSLSTSLLNIRHPLKTSETPGGRYFGTSLGTSWYTIQ